MPASGRSLLSSRQVYELAKKEIVFSLRGHTDTVLCARLSPSGTQLLSTSADGTVRLWDVRPFAPEPAPGHVGAPRLIRTLAGLPIGFEQVLIRGAWAPDGRRVIAGGGDGTMSLWNTETGELVYKVRCQTVTHAAAELLADEQRVSYVLRSPAAAGTQGQRAVCGVPSKRAHRRLVLLRHEPHPRR
jgi:WD40 repeat protein